MFQNFEFSGMAGVIMSGKNVQIYDCSATSGAQFLEPFFILLTFQTRPGRDCWKTFLQNLDFLGTTHSMPLPNPDTPKNARGEIM